MDTPSAQSIPQSLGPDTPDNAVRKAVLKAATAPLGEAFGDRVQVEVEQLDRIGPWVFLRGRLRDVAGGRPDFSGTAYEKPAAAGQMSDVYVALLRQSDEHTTGWQLRAHAIGPSDIAWETWPRDHGAPTALFR